MILKILLSAFLLTIWVSFSSAKSFVPPDELKEDHAFQIKVDGNSSQDAVDGNYKLDVVHKDGTRQQITSKGPNVQGTYEYIDSSGAKKSVNYEASREGGFRILNPADAEGLRQFPDQPLVSFRAGELKISQNHAEILQYHKSAVERAWKDQQLHSIGAKTLREKFGGGVINATMHREKDPNSNALHSSFRKEYRDKDGRLRGFQQAHSVLHAFNASAMGGFPGGPGAPGGALPFGPGGGLAPYGNFSHFLNKIREFHKHLFGGGATNGTGVGGPGPMVMDGLGGALDFKPNLPNWGTGQQAALPADGSFQAIPGGMVAPPLEQPKVLAP